MKITEVSTSNPKQPPNAQELLDQARQKFSVPNNFSSTEKSTSFNNKDLNLNLDEGNTIEVNELPSKFLPYPTGSSIKFRPYTYGQLQKLSASTLNNVDSLKFVLEGIITTGFDKKDLAFSDFLFIGLLRRLTAFSKSQFSYRFICDQCGQDNNQTGDLANITFDDIENVPQLPVVIDLDDGKTLEINPLTVGSVIKLRQMDNNDTLVSYANCVVNMSPDQAYKIISNAQGDLIESLQDVDTLLAFNNQTLDCKCTMCQADNLFNMGDITNLVQPFRSETGTRKSRIRFGRS